MTRLAALLFAAASAAGFAAADDKPVGPAIVEVKLDAGDKPGAKAGEWSKPSQITSAEELKELVADKATREKIATAMDLKTHNLLVFCWQGSGGDKIDYLVLESFPEQIKFGLKPGRTDDLRTHTKLFAVRKNVRWSAK